MRSLVAIVIIVLGLAAPAHAIPPTVSPTPGYDARLAEQRRAMQSPPPVVRKSTPSRPAARKHQK